MSNREDKPQSCAFSFKGLTHTHTHTPQSPQNPTYPSWVSGTSPSAERKSKEKWRWHPGLQQCHPWHPKGTRWGHRRHWEPPVLLTDTRAGSTPSARGCLEDSFATRLGRRVLFLLLLFLAVVKVEGFAEVLLPVGQGAGGLQGEMVTCEQKPHHGAAVPQQGWRDAGTEGCRDQGTEGTVESITPQKLQEPTALRVFTTPGGSNGDM